MAEKIDFMKAYDDMVNNGSEPSDKIISGEKLPVNRGKLSSNQIMNAYLEMEKENSSRTILKEAQQPKTQSKVNSKVIAAALQVIKEEIQQNKDSVSAFNNIKKIMGSING
jgi:hypothetical protein